MESERERVRGEQKVSDKRTPYNIKMEKSRAAAEARDNSPALMALYNFFLPGAGSRGRPKFVTDKYGNRVRTGMEEK